MTVGQSRTDDVDILGALLQVTHLRPHERATAVPVRRPDDSTLSEEPGQHKRLEVPTGRYLSRKLPVPDGTFPRPPHRGAGHVNCDTRHAGPIEDYGTTADHGGTRAAITEAHHCNPAQSGHSLTRFFN